MRKVLFPKSRDQHPGVTFYSMTLVEREPSIIHDDIIRKPDSRDYHEHVSTTSQKESKSVSNIILSF